MTIRMSSLVRNGLLLLIPLLVICWLLSPPSDAVYLPSVRDLSIESLQDYLRNGTFTSEDLTRVYLARIAEINPTVHSVAEVNPDALALARALDKERKLKGSRGKLHGIPILIKDSISAHGMNNTAGSWCLVGSKTKDEASVVTRLRAAGAIILGKANMSQWGNARCSSKTASNGWSAWGGQTFGVYHPSQDPCGSSSGSAVSMSLGLAAAAIGVETIGSITCPAMRSNMVSIKATSGLVPRDNVIVTKLKGTVGPITSTVRDAAIMLSFLAGKSKQDNATERIPFSIIPAYEKSCVLDGLRNSRLGIPRNALDNPIAKDMNVKAVMEKFEATIEVLRNGGAMVIDNANYPLYEELNGDAPNQFVGPAEYKKDMADYFQGLELNPRNIRTIEDMISCTQQEPKEEYPSRDVAYWEGARDAEDFYSPKVIAATERLKYLGGPGGIDGALDAADADALIFPSIVSSDVAGMVGYPVITVPLGFMPADTPIKKNSRGNLIEEGPNIPYGLSFIGRPFSEQRLIELAYSFEQLTHFSSGGRPILLPTTDLTDVIKKKKTSKPLGYIMAMYKMP